MPVTHAFGWKRDSEDSRDYKYTPPKTKTPLPSSTDLTKNCPSIYDQGQLGSCTANGGAGVLEYDMLLQQEPDSTPSRLFIYYNTRVIEGTPSEDSGASIRDTIKSITQFGACSESEWPYDISRFADKPSAQCYSSALLHTAVKYMSVSQTLTHIKSALAESRPVIFGFTCYDSLESDTTAQTGDIPYPDTRNESVIGGHCILLVGYDDSKKKFLIRNSWGTSWGNNGYGTIPYKYISSKKLASDFWVVETVS